MTKTERFKVVRVDGDGTYQLANLDIKKRGVENFTVWVLSTVPLRQGQTIVGTLSFDPTASFALGLFPTFAPVATAPIGQRATC